MPPLSHRKETRSNRRKKAAKLFAKGLSQAETARQCHVSREAARKWHNIWKKKGIKGLSVSRKPGPTPKLTENKKKKIETALLKGPQAFGYQTELWTLERIAALIKRIAKVKYHYRHVWRVLVSMGWSCQKPERVAKERNEKAIKYWKKVAWPDIQKRGLEFVPE